MAGKKKATLGPEDGAGPSAPAAPAPPAGAGADGSGVQSALTSADYYFNSYAHFGIHEEMLKDGVRTRAYQRAIMDNAHLFEGKVVLDVGCGTAILSMFAAKAGARAVVAVDCSEIIEQAREIVKANGLDGVITLVRGKVEEIELPHGLASVDIIISEWMGYFLLYEGMLDTVIAARDKWLKPGGLMLPDRASLHLVAIEDADYRREKLDFWDSVYGFDMSAIKRMVGGPRARARASTRCPRRPTHPLLATRSAQALFEPLVDVVDPGQVVSGACTVLEIDILTATVADLAFSAKFCLPLTRTDFVHALVAYFDVTFSCCHKPIVMHTAPHCKPTHWKQTVFYLTQTLVGSLGDELTGTIAARPNAANRRDLEIEISLDFEGDKQPPVHLRSEYRLR